MRKKRNDFDAVGAERIDGIRKWFIASLTGMGNLLDLITESPALTSGME